MFSNSAHIYNSHFQHNYSQNSHHFSGEKKKGILLDRSLIFVAIDFKDQKKSQGFDITVTMKFKKGTKIEVFNKREVPSGSWWPAEILSGNAHTYWVRYGRYSGDMGADVARVPRKAIRPCPPPVEGLGSWVAGDIVEVFNNCSWKLAQVSRIGDGDCFFVRHLGLSTEFLAHMSDIRLRQSWQDNNWVANLKDCRKFSDRMTSKLKKRPRVCAITNGTGASRKIRTIEKGGTYLRLVAGSSLLLNEKVDAVASPQEVLGEKYMHASLDSRIGFSETHQGEGITNAADNSYYSLRLEHCNNESATSSVGSCSASTSPYRSPHCVDGSTPDIDSSDDFGSSSWSGRELSFPSKEELAEEFS
ncbi:uncharacterized protein M6B38_144235 [Iris pallida]|uniref:Agenet domain-containing protein n=1 Tax=Iris pallida TaxID=29817 RepID=A0AAX6FAZ6_IRIPA|nr:uncharacterized protein M6B38_144235 [Iris pallida]